MSDSNGCSDCGDRREKDITRGQFLATGAAAAASLGAAPASAYTAAAGMARAQQPCALGCNNPTERWRIPATVLNALWSDCMPRLVARWWKPEPVLSLEAATAWTSNTGPSAAFLAQLADDIENLPDAPPLVPGTTPKLDIRRDMVVEYLRSAADPIPIRIIPNSGFDYVLSDWGLDMFLPWPPLDNADWIRYYTYRRTGRPAIGLPTYMAGAGSADIDSPTGPSQAWIDPTLIVNMITSAVNNGQTAQLCAVQAESFIQMTAAPPSPADLQTMQNVLERRGARPGAPPGLGFPLREPGIPPRTINADTVQCVLEPLRCWQVSGSVFRGIQTELPRVVATNWLEQLTSPVTPNASSYNSRKDTPNGLRKIFMERLESLLHSMPPMAMAFQPQNTPANWDADDIMVTNQGFHFPRIPQVPPTADAIMTQIVNGEAGNPVFTDSMRTT